QSSSDRVKKFARQMVEDHIRANQELADIARRKGFAVPLGMEKKHVDVLSKVGKLIGSKFDEEYLKCQVDGHEEAVKLLEREAKDGKDKDLKEWADKTLAKVKDHLKEARDLAKSDDKKDKDRDDKKDKDRDDKKDKDRR